MTEVILAENAALNDRKIGALIGLACGDAVGTTVEFTTRGSFPLLTDMVGGGPFNLPVGAWTDDTSMALCLAHSLVAQNGFDPADQMERYADWRDSGYMSSTGSCFDIGITTNQAISRYKASGEPFSGSTNPAQAGNGSIMRLAPIPIFYFAQPEQMVQYAAESSRPTHGAPECLDACRYMAAVLYELMNGADKERAIRTSLYSPETENILAISRLGFRDKPEEAIFSSGYVVHTLEAALWAFFSTNSFRDAILKVANLGDDADSTAAVCGQFAGAYYGLSGIPKDWVEKLVMREGMLGLAERLCEGVAE